MRFLFLFFTFIFQTPAAFALPGSPSLTPSHPIIFSGVYLKKGPEIEIETEVNCPRYKIKVKNHDTLETLDKVSEGDLITASGFLNKDTCTADLESIDYVGLRKLLGSWTSKSGTFTFHDFNAITFYPSYELMKSLGFAKKFGRKKFEKLPDYVILKSLEYKYSLTPTDGPEWVMFLSNQQSTTFTTLLFDNNSVTMRIYDSENGSINKIIVLTKSNIL